MSVQTLGTRLTDGNVIGGSYQKLARDIKKLPVTLIVDGSQHKHSLRVSREVIKKLNISKEKIPCLNIAGRILPYEIDDAISGDRVSAAPYIVNDIASALTPQLVLGDKNPLVQFDILPMREKISEIKSLTLKLIDYTPSKEGHKVFLDYPLKETVKKTYEGCYLSHLQTIQFYSEGCLFSAKVIDIQNGDGSSMRPGKLINPEIKIDPGLNSSTPIVLQHQLTYTHPKITFNIIHTQPLKEPLFIPKSDLEKRLKEALLNRAVYPGLEWPFEHQGHALSAYVTTIMDMTSGATMPFEVNNSLKNVLIMEAGTFLEFGSHHSDIMVGSDSPPADASILELVVQDIRSHKGTYNFPKKNFYPNTLQKKLVLFEDEIRSRFLGNSREIWIGGPWHLSLSDLGGDLYSLDVSVYGVIEKRMTLIEPLDVTKKWLIGSSTAMEIKTEKPPFITLAKTRKAERAAKVILGVKLVSYPADSSIYVTKDALNTMISNTLHEHLKNNQKWLVLKDDVFQCYDDEHRLFDITVNSIQFADPEINPKGILAEVQPQTKFNFKVVKEKTQFGKMQDSFVIYKDYSKMFSDKSVREILSYAKIGGISDSLVHELEMLRDMFRRPEFYAKLGRQLPRGILFSGPPGTGKTELMKALAYIISAKYVGMGATQLLNAWVGATEANIHNLLNYGSHDPSAPYTVIGINELDTFGNRVTSKNQFEVTHVNAMLEIFDKNKKDWPKVLVVGSTNRPEALDSALKRPKRMGKPKEVNNPDRKGILEILELHTEELVKNNSLDPAVKLNEIAQGIHNASGAEIYEIVQLAIDNAIKRQFGKDSVLVGNEDFDLAISSVKEDQSNRNDIITILFS